jgi:hypothetical protein
MLSTLPREFEIKERKTTRITAQLVAEDAVTPLPGSTLTSLTLTIYDNDDAQTVIVDNRNILNANGGSVDSSGNLVLLLAAADVPIRTAALPYERHTCLLQWTWGSSPVKTGAEELILVVRNLGKIS